MPDMAKLRQGAGFGPLSGTLGNAVFANTAQGTIVRSSPMSFTKATPARMRVNGNLARANVLWRGLTTEQAAKWQDYAATLASRDPATGLMQSPKAVNVFVGLATKYLQVHGGFEAPADPPEGYFLGDVVAVSLSASAQELVFTVSTANREGVSTELLAQWVPGPHNAPRPRSYKSLGFVAFSGSGATFTAPVRAGTWLCAFRFVEMATGRTTDLLELGRVTVGS